MMIDKEMQTIVMQSNKDFFLFKYDIFFKTWCRTTFNVTHVLNLERFPFSCPNVTFTAKRIANFLVLN